MGVINVARTLPEITKTGISVGKTDFIALRDAVGKFPDHYVGLPPNITGKQTNLLFKGIVLKRISTNRALAAFKLDGLKLQFDFPSLRKLFNCKIETGGGCPEYSHTATFRRISLPEFKLPEISSFNSSNAFS